MNKVNLISKQNLVDCTNLSNGTDAAKINPVITAVQQLYLRPILGEKLYEAVLSQVYEEVVNATPMAADYQTLLEDYIVEFLIPKTMVDLVPMLSVTVGNGGVFVHSSENANEATTEELNRIIDIYESRAKIAEGLLMDYLDDNSELFAEYDTEEDWEVDPKTSTKPRGGWYLG